MPAHPPARRADFEFLSTSCGLKVGTNQWKTCGVDTQGFVNKAQEATFSVPAWVDQIANAGKFAVGAARGAASTAIGAAGSAVGAASSVVSGFGSAGRSAIPLPFGGRRLQADQCSA
jgi:hypothetical protein